MKRCSASGASSRKKIYLKTMHDDPEVCRDALLKAIQEKKTHPELMKFRRCYRIYLTKEAIKDVLLVWGVRKGTLNAPGTPRIMSGTG